MPSPANLNQAREGEQTMSGFTPHFSSRFRVLFLGTGLLVWAPALVLFFRTRPRSALSPWWTTGDGGTRFHPKARSHFLESTVHPRRSRNPCAPANRTQQTLFLTSRRMRRNCDS